MYNVRTNIKNKLMNDIAYMIFLAKDKLAQDLQNFSVQEISLAEKMYRIFKIENKDNELFKEFGMHQ